MLNFFNIVYSVFYIVKIDLQISMNAWKTTVFAKEETALTLKGHMIALVQMVSS